MGDSRSFHCQICCVSRPYCQLHRKAIFLPCPPMTPIWSLIIKVLISFRGSTTKYQTSGIGFQHMNFGGIIDIHSVCTNFIFFFIMLSKHKLGEICFILEDARLFDLMITLRTFKTSFQSI